MRPDDFVIHVRNIRELSIDFWIQGADHKAKPHGYDGAVIIWGIRDTPPAQYSARRALIQQCRMA